MRRRPPRQAKGGLVATTGLDWSSTLSPGWAGSPGPRGWMGLKHVCNRVLTNSGDIGGSVDPVDSTCHLLFRNSTLDRSPVVVTSFIHPACLCHPNHPDNPDHPDHLDYLDPLNHLYHVVHLDHPAQKNCWEQQSAKILSRMTICQRRLSGITICNKLVRKNNLPKMTYCNNLPLSGTEMCK